MARSTIKPLPLRHMHARSLRSIHYLILLTASVSRARGGVAEGFLCRFRQQPVYASYPRQWHHAVRLSFKPGFSEFDA